MKSIRIIIASVFLISLSCTTTDEAANTENQDYLQSLSFLSPPEGIDIEFDLVQARNTACTEKKTILTLFTGYGAHSNKPPLEFRILEDRSVQEFVKDKYVLLFLLVDDRREAPEQDQVFSEVLSKKIKSLGHKWSHLQQTELKTNYQPQFAKMTCAGDFFQAFDGRGLQNINEFLEFLQDSD